jgi:hypothetical protein
MKVEVRMRIDRISSIGEEFATPLAGARVTRLRLRGKEVSV